MAQVRRWQIPAGGALPHNLTRQAENSFKIQAGLADKILKLRKARKVCRARQGGKKQRIKEKYDASKEPYQQKMYVFLHKTDF
jgi:hypothetical protein